MNEAKHKIGIFEKLGFLSFSVATNVLVSFKSNYYKYFLTSILLINPIAASNVVLIGTIWDIVNDPLVGVWAGNVRFKSGEKVRPWVLLSAFPVALGIILIFTDLHVSERWDIILAIVCFFFYELANTFRSIPSNGLGTLVSGDDEERKVINSFKSLGVGLGAGIGGICIPFVIKMFGGLKDHSVINSSDSLAIFKTAVVVGVIMFVGSLIHYFTTKERIKEETVKEDRIGFIETYKMLFSCKSWVINMFYIMTYGIATALDTSAAVYFCSYVMNNSSLIAVIMGSYLLFTIIGSAIMPKIDKMLGRKKTMIFAALIQLVGKIPILINPYSIINNIINVAFAGIGLAAVFIIFHTNRNTISDIIALKNGRRLDTMVSTADNLASKIAEAFVDKLFLVSLAAAGFSAELSEQGLMQNQATQNVIIAMLGWVSCVAIIVMALISLVLDVQKEYRDVVADNSDNNLSQ